MTERAFRLDFFIALAALIISALTAATLIYQTRVIGHQFAASIWPYLSVSTTYDNQGETIAVDNDGLGPALIQSAALAVDGVSVTSWNDYLAVLAREPDIRKVFAQATSAARAGLPASLTISSSSIGPSTTIRAGDSRSLVKVRFSGPLPLPAMQELIGHRLALDFCYCSIEGSCWTLHSSPGQSGRSDPQPVDECPTSVGIDSSPTGPAKPLRGAARAR